MIIGHGRSNVTGPMGGGHGKSLIDVTLTLAPDPKPFALQFIVECVEQRFRSDHPPRREIEGLLRGRMMIGPFETYEAAHEWVSHVGAKGIGVCLIHQLIEPSNDPPPRDSDTATIHKMDERK